MTPETTEETARSGAAVALVASVLTHLAGLGEQQALTAEICADLRLSPDQVDTVRRVLLELESAGWVRRYGSASRARWVLGYRLESVAAAARATLAGRRVTLTPTPAPADRYGHHAVTARLVDLLTALGTAAGPLTTAQADAVTARPAIDSSRRVLRALAVMDWIRRVPGEAEAWRPSDALYATAARRTVWWRELHAALAAHLRVVDP